MEIFVIVLSMISVFISGIGVGMIIARSVFHK
jgi:hypothetical protein